MGNWTNAGFEAKTLDYYKAAIQQIFVDAYGDDFLLDDSLPQGVLIQELAELFYAADMDGVEAFSRLNINTASGVYLDLIGSMRGMSRSLGTPQLATVALTISATNFMPFTIPEGHIFTDASGETFELSTATTISSPTDQVLYLQYTSTGNSSLSVNDKLTTDGYGQITDIEVTYLVDGTEAESDLEFRTRILSEYPVAQNTLQYVSNKILDLPTVRTVGVNYNDTDTTLDGLAPYSTEWMAVPKDNVDETFFKNQVASVIINNKTPGAPTDGSTTVTVTDVFGSQKTVKFTIPTQVELQILCTVATPEETGKLDLNNLTAIKETIAAYVNNLKIGDNVSYSRCMAPLAADPGFDVVSFSFKDKNGATTVANGNYPIGVREYATITVADIEIGV